MHPPPNTPGAALGAHEWSWAEATSIVGGLWGPGTGQGAPITTHAWGFSPGPWQVHTLTPGLAGVGRDSTPESQSFRLSWRDHPLGAPKTPTGHRHAAVSAETQDSGGDTSLASQEKPLPSSATRLGRRLSVDPTQTPDALEDPAWHWQEPPSTWRLCPNNLGFCLWGSGVPGAGLSPSHSLQPGSSRTWPISGPPWGPLGHFPDAPKLGSNSQHDCRAWSPPWSPCCPVTPTPTLPEKTFQGQLLESVPPPRPLSWQLPELPTPGEILSWSQVSVPLWLSLLLSQQA